MKKINLKVKILYGGDFVEVETQGYLFQLPGFEGHWFVAHQDISFLDDKPFGTKKWAAAEYSTGHRVSGHRDAKNRKEAIVFAQESLSKRVDMFNQIMSEKKFPTINPPL